MSDDDIEFLDEDAEIVQQCVQSVQSVQSELAVKIEPMDQDDEPPHDVVQRLGSEPSLLVERPVPTERPAPAKKRRKDDDDTDYDPIVDSPHFSRRRRPPPPRAAPRKRESQSPPGRRPGPRAQAARREMTVKIPDFDDPLCLPVRAMVKDEHDARRLRQWNQLCLERFRNADAPLRPRRDPVASSKRTVVIRNMFNKYSGKTETTFWSKMVVEDKEGNSKSEVVQSVLPRYREKKILTAYKLREGRRRRAAPERHEVLLTKEAAGGEDTLVAYRPDISLAMVFKMFESEPAAVPEEDRRYLLEVASCAACARCYQASWRPRDESPAAASRCVLARCPMCARVCKSASALVAHARAHAHAELRRHRRAFCDTLVQLLPHQYRCRLCQERFGSVRDTRRHLATHKGVGEFYCELGNHTVS